MKGREEEGRGGNIRKVCHVCLGRKGSERKRNIIFLSNIPSLEIFSYQQN